MSEPRRVRGLDIAWVISALCVVGIIALLVLGERSVTRWLLLAGAVSNLMVFGLLRREKRRPHQT